MGTEAFIGRKATDFKAPDFVRDTHEYMYIRTYIHMYVYIYNCNMIYRIYPCMYTDWFISISGMKSYTRIS